MPLSHDTLFIYSNNNNAMQTLIVIDCQRRWLLRRLRTRNKPKKAKNEGERAGDVGCCRTLCPFRVFLIGDRFCALAGDLWTKFMSCRCLRFPARIYISFSVYY